MLLHILAKICIFKITNIGDLMRAKTKNLNAQNIDPTDHCNKILILAWAMKISTFSKRTAVAGDFPHWQEGICSEHTCSFQESSANDYSDFQNLKTSFGIYLNGTATQPLPLETVKELVTYVFVYPPVNVPCIFYGRKELGDSDIHNFCAKQSQHLRTTPHISSCTRENSHNLRCVRTQSQKEALYLSPSTQNRRYFSFYIFRAQN